MPGHNDFLVQHKRFVDVYNAIHFTRHVLDYLDYLDAHDVDVRLTHLVLVDARDKLTAAIDLLDVDHQRERQPEDDPRS